jgi:UDP-glucose 4-epimerase
LNWTGKRALVTGGAGFIGSHLTDALVARGATVTVVDNFSTGFREFLAPSPSLQVIDADLRDGAVCDRAIAGQDVVFHLSANADIKDGLLYPRRDVEQNILVTQNVLEAMRAHGVKDVVFSSTGSVYGEANVIPTPEDAPFPVQTSLYATSKVAAEGLLSSYAYGYGLRTWIFRFVSMLGPRYTHGHVVDFSRKLRADPTRLEVLGNGRQRKSYLHVSDCIAAILLAFERASGPVNIFNIGHSEWIDVDESIRIICRELDVRPRIEYTGGDRGWVGDAPRILLDASRLRGLGWSPTRTIEESIVETLRFLIANPFCLQTARDRGARQSPT